MGFSGNENGVVPTSPRRGVHPYLHPYLLDTFYLGLLVSTVSYLFARGRGQHVTDHIPRRFKDIPPRAASRQCLWVHGVSVGEVLSVRHFLRLFSQEFPDWEIVISATTRSGIEAGRRHYPSTQIFSYPFDFSYLVKRAFDRVRPDLVIIVEHELWPNFLWHAQARGVPVAIVNGRLSQRSLRGYRWLSRVDTWPPPGVVTICVEDDVSAAAFRKLGVSPEAIRVTGNFKFDNIPKASSGVREELGFNGADWVLVAASTHQGEEKLLLDAFGALHKEDKRSRLVLAPRRVERIDKLAGLIEERGFRPLRWSKHPARSSAQNGHGEVLLVDTVGELDKITQAADVVFVGGSLVPFGGHNIIAPAGIGRPVVIGPHYTNFRSIVSTFLDREALLVAKDGGDLSRKLQDLKNDPGRARGMARRAVEAVAENAGASERTIEALRPLVQSIDARSKVEV